jgi:adenosylmethionine-8-amino-7-oxononanoate aminotransferase
VAESILTRQDQRSPVLRRSFRKPYPAAVRGEDVYLWDADGNRYLDFCASAAVNFIGHGVREIADAMVEQSRQLEFVHSSQFTTPVAEEFAAELLDFAGGHFRGGAVFFTSGGSEAIEAALKLARQYQVEIGQAKRYRVLTVTRLSRIYAGCALGFGQQKTSRDLSADGARFATSVCPTAIAATSTAPTDATIAASSMPRSLSTRSKRRMAKPLHSFLSL